MKKPLLLLIFMISATFAFSQTEKQKAEKYLKERGEIEFTFTANSLKEVKSLSSVISFDHGQDPSNKLTINAFANARTFQEFLKFDLPYTVTSRDRSEQGVITYDSTIHGSLERNSNYTLSFPLSAFPTYDQYSQQMQDFETENASIAELVNIGSVGNNRDLLFIKLSDNVGTHEQEPRLLYTSSMHGDEIAGYVPMLSLIDFLIEVYNDPAHASGRHTEIKNLIDNNEIWINPLANPNGTYNGVGNTAAITNPIRGNGNAIDLNRNYPDPRTGPHPDGEVYQVETNAFMALADTYHFVISANFHGGTEVMNYPWDTWSVAQGRHADDDWYIDICGEYAAHAQADSPNGYFDASYDSNANSILGFTGVTHGATWYQVAGGRQDYMNHDKQCREVTIELSDDKWPDPSLNSYNTTPEQEAWIENHWDYNKDALIDFLKQGTYGFRGLVKDANTLNPIQAKITIVGHDDSRGSWVNTELPLGDYYRPIEAGTYDILFEADCYQSFTLSNQVITDLQTVVLSDIFLTPIAPSVPASLSASSITTTTTTIGWSASSGGTSYDIRYRVNGSSTWTNTTASTNSLDLSGLTIDTEYEFQVRSVCNASTSSYSSSSLFTTLAVSYCASNGTTQYDTGVTMVSFNTMSNADVAKTSGYKDFTAMSTQVVLGTNYDLTVNVDTDGGYTIHAFAWIDFNRDGDFGDAGEEFDLGQINGTNDGPTNASPYTITIPLGATLGSTRMRISAKYNSNSTSCEENFDGEVEDYSILISDSVLGLENELETLNEIITYPNPVNDVLFINAPYDVTLLDYKISNILGKIIIRDKFISNSNKIDVSSLTTGMYFLSLTTDKGKVTKKIIHQ